MYQNIPSIIEDAIQFKLRMCKVVTGMPVFLPKKEFLPFVGDFLPKFLYFKVFFSLLLGFITKISTHSPSFLPSRQNVTDIPRW